MSKYEDRARQKFSDKMRTTTDRNKAAAAASEARKQAEPAAAVETMPDEAAAKGSGPAVQKASQNTRAF